MAAYYTAEPLKGPEGQQGVNSRMLKTIAMDIISAEWWGS
jgi:hypothetical protein